MQSNLICLGLKSKLCIEGVKNLYMHHCQSGLSIAFCEYNILCLYMTPQKPTIYEGQILYIFLFQRGFQMYIISDHVGSIMPWY